jgi:hypothetical protein
MDAIDAIELLQEMCSNKLVVEGLTDSPFDDFFFGLSEGNRTVEVVTLPLSNEGGSFSSWEKVGKAIGNLEALQEIELFLGAHPISLRLDERSTYVPDWYALSYVLSFLRHKIKLRIGYYQNWDEVEVQHFATAIRHNPFIKAVEQSGIIPTSCYYIFVNVLATLPALEGVSLSGFAHRDPLKASTMISMNVQVLLKSRSLRSLAFDGCCITREIVEGVILALNGNGSTLTCLRFVDECKFLDEGPGLKDIANALRTNTSLTHFQFHAYPANFGVGGAFVDEMQQVLRVNTTLTDLDLCFLHGHGNGDGDSMPQIITALGDNTTLKNCKFHMDDFEDQDLSEAMRTSLERNSALECLTFGILTMPDDDDEVEVDNGGLARLRETVSFLRINASLKSLTLVCEDTAAHDVSYLCIDTVSALAVNTSLEYLDIEISGDESISSIDYLATLAALGSNTTLKTLRLHPKLDSFDNNQVEELLLLIRKNYGLESLDDGLPDPTGGVGYILRLNKVGRRYILRDPSSVSGSIGVFAGVSNDVNCVLVHMLENPRLCDRRAVQMVSDGVSNGNSTNPTTGSNGGKRERARAHDEGRISQRRLA